ncbi:amidohydrolase [Palleronia sp. LCG004]|uniref:amidohydrolase n=1 Tax=Palleronia sp. LCG004 TaxID=3079304 RepID=UPI002941C1A3|nr:amidohydrolase [Palleronia sp. LCG004]WOI56581.1 amidohydrolase [Palleronia sp. LCG004]
MTDIVIHNGSLVTFDTPMPGQTAIAIKDGLITAIGDDATILDLAGPDTRIVDAGGNSVMPGFIDSHVHLFMGGVELDRLDFQGSTDRAEIAAMIRDYSAARPDDTLLMATGANYYMFDGRPATRHDLDEIIPDRPFAVFGGDHHSIWANTKALEMAGILYGGETDADSEIVMGDDGMATGMLVEPGAWNHVARLSSSGGREQAGIAFGRNPATPPTEDEREADKASLEKGMLHCARFGITTLHNMDGNFYQLELLSELEVEGRLPCRIEVPFHLKNDDPIDRLEEAHEMRARFTGDKVWCGRVKMFMDGVSESRTGLQLRPYPEDPTTNGVELFAPDHFAEVCIRADRAGFQISTHAIGELAVRRVLDGYEAAQNANGRRDSRHRIEHVETVTREDLPRFDALGVVPSMQPMQSPRAGWFPPAPPGRSFHDDQRELCYAFRDVRAHAPRLIFNTDWPIVPIEPMRSIQAACAPLDAGPHWADGTQTLDEALASYIVDNAWVEFNEDSKGRLAPGMMADVVVMDHPLHEMPADRLSEARPLLTICDGAITWDAAIA